jgi:hypothetical protein
MDTNRQSQSVKGHKHGEKANCLPKIPLPNHQTNQPDAYLIVIYKFITMA